MSGINLDDMEKAIGSKISTTGRNPDGFYDPKGPKPSREYSFGFGRLKNPKCCTVCDLGVKM